MHQVGDWPKELFNNLYKANEIDLGGIVTSLSEQPSPPPVGSGASKKGQLVNETEGFYDLSPYVWMSFSP